jgi:hypothetical protein
MKNLAKSEIVAIIVPLLQNWLRFRKGAPEIDPKDSFGVGAAKKGGLGANDGEQMNSILQ